MQQLILPINQAKLTASWKTQSYRTRFGFEHYGIDLVSTAGQTLVYASGNGTVLAAGYDNVFGYYLVIRYQTARRPGFTGEVICRMFHFASLLVRAGQRVTKDTKLGYYGNTGLYTTGAHLHLEMDRDVAYPYYTPTLSGRSTRFLGKTYGANDASMDNPLSWLHCKVSPPDNQRYTTADNQFIRLEDRSIAIIQ